MDCIRAESTSPTASSRNLAILHSAIYDAVNGISRTHQPYRFEITPPAIVSSEAAAVGAAHEVTTFLYPSLLPWADDLYWSFVLSNPPSEALTNGLYYGGMIGALAISSRSADGATTEITYVPRYEPGEWARTPPFFRPPLTPHWGLVEPFCLSESEPFVPGPPPALDSAEYAAAVNEVKALGGKASALRTAEQTQIAVFWSDFSYTAMPPGHWHEIAASIAVTQRNTLEENARLFALISLAQADAAIVCWETKYRYNLWRPVTAIRRADEDGNPETVMDASWDHLLAAPPFPAYTSGHSTFSKASAQVLTHFYGTDAIAFTAQSDSLPGITRSFGSLAACSDEVGMSRIYGGIHFAFDNVAGKQCGGAIGDFVSANFLLSNERLPLLRLEGVTNGVPQIVIHGHIGKSCILEASSDLYTWQPLTTNTAVSGGVRFSDVTGRSAKYRMYRVTEKIR